MSTDQVVLGNGSNELIELIVRTFLRPGDEAVVPHPSFVVYPMIVQAAGGIRVMVMLKDHRLDLEAMARAITPMTKIVFIANPNNPTATIVTADEVAHFMSRVPERTIVVFDEAYIEFAMGPDFPDALASSKQGRKVMVLRTFSKSASLAGLRVGYGVADADAIALMNRIRQPFNVNALAQVAALAALDDESHVLECVRMIEAGRHYLYDEFNALGIKYVPSRANFILVDVGRSASDIYQRLLKEGVIVRPLTPFGMESALRITVGTPQENRRLVKALRARAGQERRVIERLAIVGVGLLGGSVAKAVRARGLAREIVGVGRDLARLRPARARRRARPRHHRPGRGRAPAPTSSCWAPPVLANEALLARCGPAVPAGAVHHRRRLAPSAASCAAAERLAAERGDVHFVGSHPMAGSEKSGYGVARADLFAARDGRRDADRATASTPP